MGSGFKDWTAGDVLTAADVDGYLMRQTVMTFADASARDTALSGVLDEGMVAYLEDDDVFTVYDGSSWFQYGPGKILQVVRATDGTARSTTSASFVDASISVTITPTSASNDVMLIWSANKDNSGGTVERGNFQITDSSNNAISGAEDHEIGAGGADNDSSSFTIIGYDSPATTSATTYKGRFKAEAGGTSTRVNNTATGQLFALEISA